MSPTRFGDPESLSPGRKEIGQNRESGRLGMAEAAWRWRRSNEEAEQIVKRLDSRMWTLVRYEDVCEKPEASLRDLYGFIGVDSNAEIADFRAAAHHVIGNAMRLKSTSEIRLDERWRVALGEQDLVEFDRIAGALNRRLGYA
jgi:hypothetical protein